MKKFDITYQKKSKYDNEPQRKMRISLPNPTEDLSIDAKSALNAFINNVGSLKKFDVLAIQELNAFNEPKGLPITPAAEEAVVPLRK